MATPLRRFLLCTSTALLAVAGGCVGSTTVNAKNPLLAPDGETSTRVYFIRPDPGFRGIQDRPITIELDGEKLLELAKGQYTMLVLASGGHEMKVKSETVELGGTPRGVSSETPITLFEGEALFVLFEFVPRPWYEGSGTEAVGTVIQRDRAYATVRRLTPVGLAAEHPITSP